MLKRLHDEKILNLFKSRKSDPKKIEDVVRNHIEVAVERFLAYLEEQKQFPNPDKPEKCLK